VRILHLNVKNFRGIQSLDWHLGGDVICLVGPGDTTKTTILDAMELALAPRWIVGFSDADFFGGKAAGKTIMIRVSVGELPDELLGEDAFGPYLCGYSADGECISDPEDGTEEALVVQLRVEDDLEPHWEVIKDGVLDPKPISWRNRARLGVARVGEDIVRHMTWSRGSALGRITSGDVTSSRLAAANRAAQDAVAGAGLEELEQAVGAVKSAAEILGVRISDLRPGLDVGSMNIGGAAIALHDGDIPLRSVGLGTRRLAGVAIQRAGIGPEAILLIDEVEHGLEPHRIKRLLKCLTVDREDKGQVIMTTHSPTPVMALRVSQLGFVRAENGVTTVRRVDSATEETMQQLVRSRLGLAVLAERIIVCEGKTEVAICDVLEDFWADQHDGKSLTYCGVAWVEGGGSEASIAALELARLGYSVLYFGDSDEAISPSPAALSEAGVTVVLWPGDVCTEERLARDVPWECLAEMLAIAVSDRGEDSVLQSVACDLGSSLVSLGLNLDAWQEVSTEGSIRSAIAAAAKRKKWFKNIEMGRELARVVAQALPEIGESATFCTLSEIERWAYDT